jgi:hypothetical protein
MKNKKMTTNVFCLFAVCVLALSSCASSPDAPTKTTNDGRAVKGGMPLFVRTAVKDAPADVLIGEGSAKIGAAGLGQARTIATARARAEISRQLNSVVKDSLSDFTASSEVAPKDAVSYQESITMTLSNSTLIGSSVIEQDQDGDNNYWVVVSLGKKSVAQEINQAQAAARLAVPKAQALDAMARMEKAFDKIANEPIEAAGN